MDTPYAWDDYLLLSASFLMAASFIVADNIQVLHRNKRLSKVIAIFSVKSRKGAQVSDMPWGLIGDVACQTRNHILVIGGERNQAFTDRSVEREVDDGDSLEYTQSVQFLDLITNRWLAKYGYKDKLLPGSSPVALAKLSDGRIIKAGGVYCSGYREKFVQEHSGMEILKNMEGIVN